MGVFSKKKDIKLVDSLKIKLKMKAIKKLSIVFRLAILFMIIPFFYLYFKENIVYGIAFISLVLIFLLLRLFVFRKKYKYRDLEQEYAWAPFGYVFGGILLLLAILASFGTISDIRQGAPILLWMILALFGAWIFGFLLIYYSYKSQKESPSIIKKKEKPEEIFSKEKVKKFWIYYLIVFMIIAAILRYIFKTTQLTLTNIVITIAVIVFMYFYLRIALPTKHDTLKKKKKKVLFIILIFLLIFFGFFIYGLIVSLNKVPSDKCVSRGIFPKNGIPGLQYCEEDSECIKVIDRYSCCDACYGGKNNAINKKHIDFWECVRLKDKNCSNYECKENVTSWTCFAQAGCDNNICRLIEEPVIYNLSFSNFECEQGQVGCYVNCTWEVYNGGNYPAGYKLNISFYDKELERSIHNTWGKPYSEVQIHQYRTDYYEKDYSCVFGKEGFEYIEEFTVMEY